MKTARWKLALAACTLGSVIAVGGAEYWARQQVPTRLQKIYSADEYRLEIIDGVPTWKQNPDESVVRWNLDCFEDRPAAPRVAIMGSSIFYGVRLSQQDSLGPQLTRLLSDQLGEEPCITNLSEAGFSFSPQWARARTELPSLQPDVLIWEVWSNSTQEYKMLGDSAYNFGRLELDETGHPNPYNLGTGLNHWLLERSGLFRYLVFGSTPEDLRRSTKVWEDFAATEVTMLMDWASEEGIELVLVYCPSLQEDFATTAAKSEVNYGYVERVAEKRSIAQIYLAREFVGMEPETLGIDTCCHFNPLGTTEVAKRISAVVGPLLLE